MPQPLSPWKKLLFGLVPVLALAAAGEALVRYGERHRPTYWTHPERLTTPAYVNKPWFSKAFLTEAFQQPGGWFSPPDRIYVLPNNWSSPWHNVVDHERVTTGRTAPAAKDTPQLFLLGGSTTFCGEVPDDYTWPSFLQKRLGDGWKVRNLGVTSAMAKQELQRLQDLFAAGERPRAVVFLDGANEIGVGVYNNDPGGTLAERERREEAKWTSRVARHFHLLRMLIGRVHRPGPEQCVDAAKLEPLAELQAQEYLDVLLKADALCRSHGARFLALLQPTLYSLQRKRNAAEERVAVDDGYLSPNMEGCVRGAYPRLQDALKKAAAKGVHVRDLSGLFEDDTEPKFLDFCHVESHGNELIAAGVYRAGDGYLWKAAP